MDELKCRVRLALRLLKKSYPDAHCELYFKTNFQLLVATILSARCTDKSVNALTPALFKRYPAAAALGAARRPDVERLIKSIGLYRNKSKNIIETAKQLVLMHKGKVPSRMEDLVALPGVGRKTANVVLFNGFGLPGLPVDTHVLRVGGRLGFFKTQDPLAAEATLNQLIAKKNWGMASHLLIWHGRRVCFARKPDCGTCPLIKICPSAFTLKNI